MNYKIPSEVLNHLMPMVKELDKSPPKIITQILLEYFHKKQESTNDKERESTTL